MPLHIGIVGLPNVGKSTLFQVITRKEIDRANYPFCTIDPNVGTVMVPDNRVDKLAALAHSLKKIYTVIEFVDIAGLVKGASKGKGLGNKFLANVREVDMIVYVLRAFVNDQIINVQPSIDILRDKEILDTEMALKDLVTLEKRINAIAKKAKTNDKEEELELMALRKAQAILDKGGILSEEVFNDREQKILKEYQLLTLKQRLYLLNGKEEEIDKKVIDVFEKNKWPYLVMDILTEFDGANLSLEERISFGIAEKLNVNTFVRKTYSLLDLITFFTTGPDEARAWTLKKGSTAPQAGGVIHTDFEKNFIKADVIQWEELLASGGFSSAQKKGLVRMEGKNYLIQDGDVIIIRSGV
jgi:GTP-binding protein YchF